MRVEPLSFSFLTISLAATAFSFLAVEAALRSFKFGKGFALVRSVFKMISAATVFSLILAVTKCFHRFIFLQLFNLDNVVTDCLYVFNFFIYVFCLFVIFKRRFL